MAATLVGEEHLVSGLFLAYRSEDADDMAQSEPSGMKPSEVVLGDAQGFEPARRVHRWEVESNETEQTKEATDHPHHDFSPYAWPGTQFLE
jgi:hypothetical protein